jgi:predicted MFS family arabinose efflux permease
VASSLSSILGAGLGGLVAGLLTIRGLFAVTAGTSVIAVVLVALAVLPVAGRSVQDPPPALPQNEVPT